MRDPNSYFAPLSSLPLCIARFLHPFHFYHSFQCVFILDCCAAYIPLPSAFTSIHFFDMVSSTSILLTSVALSFASPFEKRAVTSLNQEAFEEAQQRDDTATRAFSGTSIKVSVRTQIVHLICAYKSRLQMDNVYSSTNFQAISAPT